jgi:hypothetical protein
MELPIFNHNSHTDPVWKFAGDESNVSKLFLWHFFALEKRRTPRVTFILTRCLLKEPSFLGIVSITRWLRLTA